MDMLEDYLRAVSRLLPRAKRDDIVAELRDEILTRVEAKEAELGRALTPDETEQVLRDFGHPIVVAARYRDEPQYAVGPALYPFWNFAVRLAILIQIVISGIVFLARVIGGGNIAQAFGQAIGSGLTGVMILIGFATVGAWLIERNGIKLDYLTTWRVRDLRFLDFADWGDMSDWMHGQFAARDRARGRYGRDWLSRRSAASRGIGIIVGAGICILWWTGVISFGLNHVDFKALPLDAGALAGVDWPALKAMLYWPILVYLAVAVVFGAALITWPRAIGLHGLMRVTTGAFSLALTAWLWFSSPVAAIVSVPSLDALTARVTAFFAQPAPFPLVTLATVILVIAAISAAGRILIGLWEIAAPGYREQD